jgi:hypothetical protein
MVSFILRKVFYGASIGADEILLDRKKKKGNIVEIEKQVSLCKKIMNSIQDKGVVDHAALIRAEGRLRKLELRLTQEKYKVGISLK